MAVTKRKLILFIGALCLVGMLVICGFLLSGNTGSEVAKKVVDANKHCQQLKQEGSSEYEACQAELDGLAEQLLKTKELYRQRCRPDPEDIFTVLCWVRVWHVFHRVVLRSPTIVHMVGDTNGPEHRKNGEILSRKKRTSC